MFNDCISLLCGPNILKMADKFNANIFDKNCINFQKNLFDKYIDKLLNKIINENKNNEDLIEPIIQDLEDQEDTHYISYFISKFDIVKFIIKYEYDFDKIRNWIEENIKL